MAFINIDSFGGVALAKFSQSGLDKLAMSQAQNYDSNDFDLTGGDTIPYVAENFVNTNDGVIQFATYAGSNGNLCYTYIKNGPDISSPDIMWSSGSPFWGGYKIALAVSDDENYPYSGTAFIKADGTVRKVYKYSDLYSHMAEYLTPPITYTWQSVFSISGKNGILFLSTIQSVYLNNGDPVNNAPANYIQFADDSNVAILVGEQVDDPTLVTIQYIVPTGTYEYIKLVYKVDSAPTSITDGTAVDILQTNRSVTISGIANGNTYFFKIFTDVSESEPYEFTTTKPPIASNYVFELDLSTDGKDIVRYDATKDIGNHKQGELYGSGISIEDGILTTSSWIYWDYDGTENPKFIPANCTLTFEYDTFFPNGEGYLDWYIIDSSGTQQIYWCFDTQHAFQSNKWYNCKTVAKVQNGKIVRYKYVLDGNEVSSNTADINMPCVNTETSLGISQIYFRLTRTTKFKNMSIYFDFSEYHDGGGSGSGSSGRA